MSSKYYFRVSSYHNIAGSSLPSNEATATTQATPVTVPDAPSNLQAAAISNMRIDLSWTDNSDNEEAFVIQISSNGTTFSKLGEVKPNVTVYQSTSLTPETTYYYRVYAQNSAGGSGYSTAKATTKPTPGSVPNPPTNLQAKAVSDVQIKIEWTDNSTDEDGFNIEIAVGATEPASDDEWWWIAKVKPNETSFLAGSLDPETSYWFRVNAYNFYGPSAYSNAANATSLPTPGSAPAKPTNLVAKAYSDTQISIGWGDNSNNEDGFNIEISEDGTNFKWLGKVGPDIKEYLAGGLKFSTPYYFRVNAFNKYGPSAYSNTANATTNPKPGTAPEAPSNLQARAVSDTMIDLMWQDNADNEDGFNIEVSENGVNFQFLDKVGPDITKYSLGGLKPNLTLWFRVNAFNRYGPSGNTNVAKVTTLPTSGTVPKAPSNLVAKAVSDTQIVLGWSDNSDNEDVFNIEMALGTIPDVPPSADEYIWIGKVGPNTKEYLVGGMNPATIYWFRINAYNKQGASAYSNTASAETPPATGSEPNAPTDLLASTASDTVIELTWNDASDNEDGFNIVMATGTVEPAEADYVWIAKVMTDITYYAVEGLKPDTQYWFKVNAYNKIGVSIYTDPSTAKTKPSSVTVPDPPDGLVAVAESSSVISLGWNDNSNNEDGFNIEMALEKIPGIEPSDADFGYIATAKSNQRESVVEGLKPNTVYWFRVNAFNKQGQSVFCDPANASTMVAPGDPPAAPTNLTATAMGEYIIQLNWEDNSAIEEAFIIEISEDGINFTFHDKVGPNTISYDVGGLIDGMTYYFRIYATNEAGESSYSNVASDTASGEDNVIIIIS